MTSREKAAELVKQLREQVTRGDPIALAAANLLLLLYDEAKESLVSSSGEDMLLKQGAARALKNLHKDLTNTPPNISPGAKA